MKKLLLVILGLCALLTACSDELNIHGNICTLYYFDTEQDNLLIAVTEKLDALTIEDSVHEAFLKLKTPEEKKLAPVITSDIKLTSLSVTDSVCEIELSTRYSNLPDMTRTAVDACLVKTICSIDGIERVLINCDGVPFGDFTDGDFLIAPPRTYYDVYTVNLYYSNAKADGLQADRITLSLSPDTTLEHAVLSRILFPSSGELKSAVPPGTRLNNVYVSEGVCYVDLSREFIENVTHDELHEGMAVYSIVNTMTELPMINSVKFLIDGNAADGYIYFRLSDSFTNSNELLSKRP